MNLSRMSIVLRTVLSIFQIENTLGKYGLVFDTRLFPDRLYFHALVCNSIILHVETSIILLKKLFNNNVL